MTTRGRVGSVVLRVGAGVRRSSAPRVHSDCLLELALHGCLFRTQKRCQLMAAAAKKRWGCYQALRRGLGSGKLGSNLRFSSRWQGFARVGNVFKAVWWCVSLFFVFLISFFLLFLSH